MDCDDGDIVYGVEEDLKCPAIGRIVMKCVGSANYTVRKEYTNSSENFVPKGCVGCIRPPLQAIPVKHKRSHFVDLLSIVAW